MGAQQFTDAMKNAALDAMTALTTHVSLHDGFPGLTGANEIAGGAPAYARQSITWSGAAAADADSSNTPTFDVPAAAEVQYIGLWSAAVAGTFRGWLAKGMSQVEGASADAGTDAVTSVGNGLANGNRVAFFGADVPAGLTEGTLYHVVGAATDSFQVSATAGGAAVDITDAGSGGWTWSKITVETYGDQGTYELTDVDLLAQNAV